MFVDRINAAERLADALLDYRDAGRPARMGAALARRLDCAFESERSVAGMSATGR